MHLTFYHGPLEHQRNRDANPTLPRHDDRRDRRLYRATAWPLDDAEGHEPQSQPKIDALAGRPSVLRNSYHYSLCLADAHASVMTGGFFF